jgi:hypothetical protein
MISIASHSQLAEESEEDNDVQQEAMRLEPHVSNRLSSPTEASSAAQLVCV